MTKRRQVALLWIVAGTALAGIAAVAGPTFWIVSRCIADYSESEALEARVVRDETHGVSLRTEPTAQRPAEECIVLHSELPAKGVQLGERVVVVLHARIPGRCTPFATLEASSALYYALLATFVALLLGLLLLVLGIQRKLNDARPGVA